MIVQTLKNPQISSDVNPFAVSSTQTDEEIYDVTIIGSGPSGLTAAIYTSRASLNTLVLGGSVPGGQLTTTTEVENFPGFPQGITGPELVFNMRQQAERFGTEFIDSDVVNISGSFEAGFVVKLSDGEAIKTKSIIVSTGASAKWLDLESEQRMRGKGVSACATCDAYFFKGKDVAVVGGGDVALEEAVFLTKFCKKVYVLVRKDKEGMRASKFMQDRAFANSQIEFVFNTEILEVLGDESVSGLKLLDNVSHTESELSVQGLFVAIGHVPNTSFLSGFVDLDEKGYVKVEGTSSSVKGVFVSGDVADFRYRQAITAAGFGCMAALDAEKLLSH